MPKPTISVRKLGKELRVPWKKNDVELPDLLETVNLEKRAVDAIEKKAAPHKERHKKARAEIEEGRLAMVKCEELYDFDRDTVTTIRLDTNEEVEVREMGDADHQQNAFDETRPAKD